MITAKSIIASGSGFSIIRIQTSSTSETWAGIATTTNSGDPLRWSVSGDINIPEVVNNNPVINLSENPGIALVRVRNRDRFRELSSLSLLGENITAIDLRSCRNLMSLTLQDNPDLSAIDLSNNQHLSLLNIRNCSLEVLDVTNNNNLSVILASENNISNIQLGPNLLTSLILYNNNLSEIDISGSPLLLTLHLANNNLSRLDISNTPDLTELDIRGNSLLVSEIDTIIMQLDGFGQLNGSLNYSNQIPEANPTEASLEAYNNLIAKGWELTGAVPA